MLFYNNFNTEISKDYCKAFLPGNAFLQKIFSKFNLAKNIF